MTLRLLSSRVFVAAVIVGYLARVASSQDIEPEHVHDHEHHHDAASEPSSWSWTTDANVIVGYNYQQRQFLDYKTWESQNWFMLSAERGSERSRLSIDAMGSLEALTLKRQGSPQLFQNGETYKGVPLVNFQHPHDVLMGLGATYQRFLGSRTLMLGADLVGSPTLGPPVFMHRTSAQSNPQVPLSHHYLDSTHISAGVVRGAYAFGVASDRVSLSLEASAFRGAEPDDDRWNIETPRLDSWATRVQFVIGAWQAQVSGGFLKQPEPFEPFDVARLTASVSYGGAPRGRALNLTAAWGQNRELSGIANANADALLVEADLRATRRSGFYGRFELAEKELLGLEFHTKETARSHPHFPELVRAGTIGYDYLLPGFTRGETRIGADVTFYGMPPVLAQFWGGSRSFHIFLRWRPSVSVAHHH